MAKIKSNRTFPGFIILIIALFICRSNELTAQEKNYNILLNRGRLWHSFDYAQDCEPLSDWTRKTYGLDWPGFSSEELAANIGGNNSHLVTGGFYITAKNDDGTVWGWDDFAINARGWVEWSGDNYRYLVNRHQKRWKDGANYWLATDPNEAEEVIDTRWEYNPRWFQNWDNMHIPVRINRTVRQWSGSQADEDYVLIEYKITNIRFQFLGRDTVKLPLNGVYLLFTYGLSPNHRGWRLKFPNFPDGARNTHSTYDPETVTLLAWAGDFKETPNEDESFDYFEHQRYDPFTDRFKSEPEFLAPGKMGIRFLHISADSTGQENRINGFYWSAAPPSNDHSGPFLEVAGIDNKYSAMADPSKLTQAFNDANDPRMGRSRLYANFSLGPFYMQPGDSIKVVLAQFVGGATYAEATDPTMTREKIAAKADSAVNYLKERVKFNYDNHYRVPMPPRPPQFTVQGIDSAGLVANVIRFDNSSESIPDPHQQIIDIAGYRIYRSWNFPFGPWSKIADIAVGDADYYDAATQTYTFVDRNVALGFGYHYAVTAYDLGHASWAVNPSVAVPPLESSLYANRRQGGAFMTTLKPGERALNDVTVVPNPFYRHSGLQMQGNENTIFFVNLSRQCIIRIYNVRGDLVKTIRHENPASAVAAWNQISDNGQFVKSGMYFYHIENSFGDVKRGKFTIVK